MIDNTFKKLIENSSNIVVFTGAGISTESGIPDFRSPTGIWKKYQPIEFSDFLSSETVRIEAWRRKFEIDKNISKAMPNIGHMAIVKLVESGKVKNVITQNIDNLHQESGIPNDIIIELHGNTTYAKCLDCGFKYNLSKIMKEFKETNKPPYCDLFITIGSSLQVYPAAGFPILAKKNGSKLIILNREKTDLDIYADLVINDEIGSFLSKNIN